MKKSDVQMRPATAEDIAHFSDMEVTPTIRGWVAEQDGELLGIAGFARARGRWWAFFDITDKLRAHKKFIVKSGKKFIEEAQRQGVRYLYAEADPNEPLAVRWMESLGFELDRRSGTLYRWKNGGP